MTPGVNDFWFLPLGGCGEIGMNMSLYGHDGHWLMVDCGAAFRDPPDRPPSGYDVQMADPHFIEAHRERLAGLLLTHAHEDHIGAVPWLWPRLRCPVYATAFAAEMLRRKLTEHGLETAVPVHLVEAGSAHTIEGFEIEWVPHTHSIPDPCGLLLQTRAGSVFHTADWKFDPDPPVGHGYDEGVYRRIGDRGLDALVCDSTGALQSGHSLAERDLYAGLLEQVRTTEGRAIVACFGSNIARLSTLARVATATGRHLGLLGRSMRNTFDAARTVGIWPDDTSTVDSAHIGWLPRDTLLLAATGSQGEARTALDRLSRQRFRDLALDAGDRVIFSARAIPGNETDIERLIERLAALGVEVVRPEDTTLPIHASGHPSADELMQLFHWTRPKALIPVHGEAEHMAAQAALGRSAGIERRLTGRDGDLFMISPVPGVRREAIRSGRLGVRAGKLERIA